MTIEYMTFVKKHDYADEKIAEYKKIEKLAEFDFISLVFIGLISLISSSLLGPSANLFGIKNFATYAIFITLILLWGLLFVSLSRRQSALGISERGVVYYHLANAAQSYEEEPLEALNHLSTVGEALEDDTRICHPKRESEISQFIERVENLEDKEEQKQEMLDNFGPFIRELINEIEEIENSSLLEPSENQKSKEENNVSEISTITVIKNAIQNEVSSTHIKIAIPILIFTSAVITAVAVSIEGAAVILGALTLIQTIFIMRNSERNDR